MSHSLYFDLEGLSFAARAGLATITAYTYENQEAPIAVKVVKHTLALSDEAWSSIYEELDAAGHVWTPVEAGAPELVALCNAAEILRYSMGYAGRPSARDWAELRDEALKEYGHACVYCGVQTEPLALDHVVAVSAGGSNHRANLVPACKSCNSAKGAKSWAEWYPIMLARNAAE